MHRTTRARLENLNPHLVCVLCGGYFIDATSIIECLHSFCRTCVVRYLESSKYCPICDVQVHKTKPLLNIRADKTLQNLVYKLVPGLFEDEMRRRREFHATHQEERGDMCLETRGEAVMEKEVPRLDDNISLCLDMSKNGLQPFVDYGHDIDTKPVDRRFLLCPSDLTIGHLKKFIRVKFTLPEHYQIHIYHTEESLTDTFTLLDIAFLYTWKRRGPLKLFYTVDDKPKKKSKRKGKCSSKEMQDVSDFSESKKPKLEPVEPQKEMSQVETHEHSDMFSDISDYDPSPLPDFSQQIHITSEGSDSTINYLDREDSTTPLHNIDEFKEEKINDFKNSDTVDTKNIGDKEFKTENQETCFNVASKELETIRIENSSKLKGQNHVTTSSTEARSRETFWATLSVKTNTNSSNSKDKASPQISANLVPRNQQMEHALPIIPKVSSKDKGESVVPSKPVNGISKEKDLHLSKEKNWLSSKDVDSQHTAKRSSSYIACSPTKIWQKPNGIGLIKKDKNRTNGLKSKVFPKFQNFEDRVNNNTIRLHNSVTNGHDRGGYPLEIKSEPLDLSETSSRRKSSDPV